MKPFKYRGLTPQQIETKCKQVYLTTYVREADGSPVLIYSHDGKRVIFTEHHFYHAFSFEDKRNLGMRKFSYQRARLVLWIKEIVTGNQRAIFKDTLKLHKGLRILFRRLYYDKKNKYLVVLKYKKNKDLEFLTHYLVKNKIYEQDLLKDLGK